jgi:hypothetical protein
MEETPLYFVTFADSRLHRTLARIKQQAKELNVFTGIMAINETNMTNSWKERNARFIMENPRGFGLWIWKPEVILQALNKMPDNAILVYADAGCTLNKEGIPRLKEYVEMVKDCSGHRLAFQLTGFREEQFTTEYALRALDFTSREQRDSFQLLATTCIIQKTSENIAFITLWNQLVQAQHMLTGGLHISCCSSYRDHRHDQSIWSILNKKFGGAHILHDETYFEDGFEKNKKFPIHATRLKY